MKLFYFLILTLILQPCSAQGMSSVDEESKGPKNTDLMAPTPKFQRDLLLGNILKQGLETLHFAKKEINNDLSKKAFNEYLKMLDFGQRFLTSKDVRSLKKYESKIDDEIITGKLELLRDANKIMRERTKYVQEYVLKRLEKPFQLETNDKFELDSEKRSRVREVKDLEKLWDQILLVDVLNNYLNLQDEQNPEKQKEKDKKKKKDKEKKEKKKNLTAKEMEVEARKQTKKRYSRVFERMLKEDHSDELNKFFNSVTKIFDPHTQYLPPREKEDFDISMSGSLEGIGAILREDGSYIKVQEIIPGSASWKGKQLKNGDIILKVGQGSDEPVDIVGMRVEEAVQLIRGKKGTEVRLTVKHSDGSEEIVPIVRDVVVIEESYVKFSTVEHKQTKKKFGYIQVPQFYRDFSKSIFDKSAKNCTDDVRNALQELKKQKISGIILDLRNNGGGSLEDAKLMSGLFIKEGPIVQVKNYEGKIDVLKDTDTDVEYDGPLVIMTNKFSASASEILAGALQDYGRALIVGGEVTHGKGTVQTLLDLDRYINPKIKLSNPLGSIKLTIQKFYRINGGTTQYKGVTPDIILPDPLAYIESGERYHDYSLEWDTVEPLGYKKWQFPLSKSELKKQSKMRVSKNEKFKKIKDSVKYLKDKKDDTKVKLSLSFFRNRRDSAEKDSKNLEYGEINKDIVVDNVSLDMKLLSEDQKERKTEWVDTLKKDPFLEETLFILNDLSKFTMAFMNK